MKAKPPGVGGCLNTAISGEVGLSDQSHNTAQDCEHKSKNALAGVFWEVIFLIK